MKKIDKLLLNAFIGPFFMTFLVVVFILLTQHMLKYFDDIIGKGLGVEVIGTLLFYFAIFMTPVAMPLAVLLSSLIAFGNLGEHFELTAIKSAGISLVRTLRPIFFFVLFLTVVAFYANNNLVPKAALEAYSLMYDIKQKKPALDLREGAFYNGINDISIKVNKKFPDGITITDVVVYDHRKNDGNKEVTVADSGKMYTILNERYLKFELFHGYNYSEGASIQKETPGRRRTRTESMSRSRFDKSQIVFDLKDFDLKPTEKRAFEGNRMMRNLDQLQEDTDSIYRQILSQRLNYYQFQTSYFSYLGVRDSLPMPPELVAHQKRQDSLLRARFVGSPSVPSPGNSSGSEAEPMNDQVAPIADSLIRDTVVADTAKPVTRKDSTIKTIPKESQIKATPPKNPRKEKTRTDRSRTRTALNSSSRASSSRVPKTPKSLKPVVDTLRRVNRDSLITARIDSVFNMPAGKQNYQGATNQARQVKTNIQNTNQAAENYAKELIAFKIQWHKILASSMACIAMFLIGAPLGAIIKKGGLGMPFLVSILFFIIYYVISMQGEKLAKQGAVSPAAGVWMADAILFVIGILFLRTARADARLFEADFYSVVFDKIKRWWQSRRKPVGHSVAP